MNSQPNSDLELNQRHLIHLNWMFENQPDLARQLHQSGSLPTYLDERLQPALRRTEELKAERGLSEDEAFEIAAQELLCPADGPAFQDNPPPPVPPAEQRSIRQSL